MKPIIGKHLWHYWCLGFEAKRLRMAIGWEKLSGRCRWLKFVPPVKAPWRGGCLWLWRLGLGFEWR